MHHLVRSVCSLYILLLLLSGCKNTVLPEKPKGPPPIGTAFAGPMTLNLRSELASSSPVAATVKHGDKLDILLIRRRFVKVRSASGVEGWTDTKQLLTAAQMDELKQLSNDAIRLPSQGAAKATELLNLHGKPSRQAPSFYQIAEGTMVQVVAHRIAARNAPESTVPLVVIPPKAPRQKKGKDKRGPSVPPPPMPKAPAPPKDWLELSNTSEEDFKEAQEEAAKRKKEEEEARKEPVKLEDWYLILTPDKKAGWVLSRMVSMAIPDEVAQYAEGSRITSYFALGEANDDGVKHSHWLWTTQKHPAVDYDYDAFRVFIWSVRHHRYETAYAERKLVGYYPSSVHPVTVTLNKKPAQATGFSVLAQDDNGKVARYTYWFEPSKVRYMGSEPAQRPALNASGIPIAPEPATAKPNTPAPGTAPKDESWTQKMKEKITKLLPGKAQANDKAPPAKP